MTRHECNTCVSLPMHPCPFHGKILAALWGDGENKPSALALSPTRMQGCMRARYLEAHGAERILDPYRAWNALRGTMAHAMLEMIDNPAPGVLREVKEMRFETTLQTRYGPKKLVGQPDLIEVLFENDEKLVVKVTDWKSIKEIAHDFLDAKEAHQKQVNMYAYLLAKALPDALGQPGLEVVVDELEIVYFDMAKVRRFTSKTELADRGAILSPRSAERYRVLHLGSLVLKSVAEMETHITEWMETAIEAEIELAPIRTGQEAALCNYCAYKRACFALYEKEGR